MLKTYFFFTNLEKLDGFYLFFTELKKKKYWVIDFDLFIHKIFTDL